MSEDQRSKEEARHWGQQLSNVLEDQRAIQHFKKYLEMENMNTYLCMLLYIERCDKFLNEEDPGPKKETLKEIQKQHLRAACQYEVAAGPQLIKAVRDAIKNDNVADLDSSVRESRNTMARKLNEGGYPEYQRHLLTLS